MDETLKQSDAHLQTLSGVITVTAASILGPIGPNHISFLVAIPDTLLLA
mgnify:CR=1 FL=1